MECPIARSMAQIGDGWRILILRDVMLGFRRFDDFEADLGIAPNILTQRLASLVADGLLERRRYQRRPPRYEYVPTDKAWDLWPIIVMLIRWGTKWLSPDGTTLEMVDRATGRRIDPAMLDRATRQIIGPKDVVMRPGPGAGAETLGRYERLRRVRGSLDAAEQI
jgi:DNA-binding HxlR family transcriptional regulator